MALFSLYELDRKMSRSEVLDALSAVPARLREILAGVPEERLSEPGLDGGWSPMQVVGHMRDAALIYSIRFRWMIFDDNPTLPNYDENAWVAASRDRPPDLEAILGEIAASRSDLIRVLSRLPEAAWSRQGRHEVLGAVSLEPYVRHQLAHEEGHLAQAQRNLLPPP